MRFFFCLFYLFILTANAQNDKKILTDTIKKRPIDVNFLFAYYEQNGDHGAVTGGIGSANLYDKAMKTIVNVPLDSISDLTISHHVNRYSSASTDNINKKMSSASAKDFRTQLYLTYKEKNTAKHKSYGFLVGGSIESDYLSASFGGLWAKESKDKNREINLKAQIMFDKWLIIIPNELRSEENETISTNKRNSFLLSINYAQVITKRFQASISSDLMYQKGLLSTPFHRVFFENTINPKVEKFPIHRFKLPIGFRLNYFINDFLILKNYYRYYIDNFDIQAHTYEIEIPLKLPKYWTIYPFYRYHIQTAAFFFAPYKEHQISNEFYTSDYDLANLSNQKIGLGISYSPLYGITRHRLLKRINVLKKMSVRYAWYQRSDGLKAWIITTGFDFVIN